jgi:hypothetical protein
MNKQKKLTTTKLAVFAGAAALVSLTPQARAQSSDALIDKLVDKGILTVSEAKDLREETDKDFKSAFQAKMGMPDWVSGYKFSGDVRGRFEHFSSDNNFFTDRTRERYRIRFGITASLLDNLEAGFRLASGDAKGLGSQSSAGNSLSANSTMQDNFTRKGIYIDAAYGKWTALNSGGWLLAATVGKMDNPFAFTPMVFDPDLVPEGAALTGSYIINDNHNLAFGAATFVMDEEASNTHDPFLYGGQVLWNAKWTPKWSSTVGVGAFAIVSPEQLTTANVPLINQGNSRQQSTSTPPGGSPTTVYGLQYNYNPIIADASVTYTMDSFPLYAGAFPIKFQTEFINNPGAKTDNNGYWVGFQLGKSGTKKTWDISYRYEYLEADAWYDQLVDDDNGAFYPGNPAHYGNTGASTVGYFGGTNVKGHLIKFNYSFTDSLTFSTTCFINDLISTKNIVPVAGVVPDAKTSAAIHFMADLMWKF